MLTAKTATAKMMDDADKRKCLNNRQNSLMEGLRRRRMELQSNYETAAAQHAQCHRCENLPGIGREAAPDEGDARGASGTALYGRT